MGTLSGVRKATGSHYTYSIPGKTAALVPEFAVENCLWQNCSLGSFVCSEGPALLQNALMCKKEGGSMAQVVRHLSPTAGVQSSRLSHPYGFCGGQNGVWVGFSQGFSHFLLPQISFHHFSTLISFI